MKDIFSQLLKIMFLSLLKLTTISIDYCWYFFKKITWIRLLHSQNPRSKLVSKMDLSLLDLIY
jgi:hypothetical protein